MESQESVTIWKNSNTVVKTLAISQPLYVASIVSIPDSFIQKVNTVLSEFVWGCPDTIKREVLIKEYIEGGLKMTCIKSILQAQTIKWVTRLYSCQLL